MPEPVVIVDYDPAWPEIFETLQQRVAAVLGGLAVTIEHVGSTAVPGLAAKPIIDMDVVVRSSDDVPAAIERLALLGYAHRGDLGIPGREAFAAPPGTPPHHLYVIPEDASAYRHHVSFRDYLRRHPDEAAAYADFKKAAARRVRHDRAAYTDSKDAIIKTMLGRAEE